MNKLFITLLMCGATLMASAQYTFDVLKLSETELSGTARYMSMAGAYGAVGGDISSISQNPGGIGIYRSSDIAATVSLNFLSTKSPNGNNLTDTKFLFNNIGYVGSMKVDSDVFKYFNWGFSFNRIKSFNRRYNGIYNADYSMTNKIADYLNARGCVEDDLYDKSRDYLYYDSNVPWLGILAYNSLLLSCNTDGQLQGMWGDGTKGETTYLVDELGHTDEYNITLGGNISNKVYWGINFGVTDLDLDSYKYYGEYLDNAYIYDYDYDDGSVTTGYANYDFKTYQRTKGTGYNFKMGVIVKPINELRIGAAFHTPTYYDIKDYRKIYSNVKLDLGIDGIDPYELYDETGVVGYNDEYRYTIKTPWRFIGSLAVVPNSKGLISFDYEYTGANTMRCGDEGGRNYSDTEYMVKEQLQPQHTVRIGAEYRVTPSLSLRAGYSYQTSPVKDYLKGKENYDVDVDYASDFARDYSYEYDKSNQYITCGLGYRYKHFYADAAYVHRTRTSQYHAFPGEIGEEIKDNDNKVALTLGFRF